MHKKPRLDRYDTRLARLSWEHGNPSRTRKIGEKLSRVGTKGVNGQTSGFYRVGQNDSRLLLRAEGWRTELPLVDWENDCKGGSWQIIARRSD